MEGDRRCPKCGQLIPRGEANCPYCRAEASAARYTPQTILLFCLLGLIILLAITGFTVRAFNAKQLELGQEFHGRGESELNAGQPEKAIGDFQTALLYSRNNYFYQLRLAEALLAANHKEQARVYLSELWERHPERAVVNLELGRLAVAAGDVNQALLYFHNAIYGEWEGQNASEKRREARLELYQFLASRGTSSQAEAELEALAAELPADAQLHTQVGDLFLKSGQFDRALSEYHAALQVDKNRKDALAGAGEADFHLGNYRIALPYLWRALKQDPRNTKLVQLYDMTKLVLSIDPYDPNLSNGERNARILRAFEQAATRLRQCAEKRGESLGEWQGQSKGRSPGEPQATTEAQTPLRTLDERAMKMKPRLSPRTLSRSSDMATNALDFVKQAENLTYSICGEPTGLDEAIVLVERKYGGMPR